MKTRRVLYIVYCAMFLALFMALDYVSQFIPLFKMPNGGSISLGIIPLLLASYLFGPVVGVGVGLLSIPLQFILGPIYFVTWQQFFLDYVLGFGIYGIAILFPNLNIKIGKGKLGIYTGIIISAAVRFLSSTASGVWYFGYTWEASAIYNFGYIFATMLVCLILVPIIHERLKATLTV